EFAARLLAGVAHARLRLRQYAEAIALYEETLRRFPSSAAAPEATYFLGVCEYRADPDGNDLRKQWHRLQSKFPQSEWRIKQSFIEQA
ncbi:MAG: tetratricopeptide repeat protein, partial [bacterium]|nr:tetratricopeptide repeat protein [bacterium]